MAFWKKIFKSKYTGREIDAGIAGGVQVPNVDADDNGKVLKVSAGKWAVGEDKGDIVRASTLTGDFISQLQVTSGNNVNTYPLAYLAPATFIQAFHTDGTTYSEGNVGVVKQKDYPGEIDHFLDIHNPIIFGISTAEATELTTTGTTSRVVTVDESEDDATVYIDTNSVLRFIIDTFSFDCSLVVQSSTIYFHGSTILVANESLYFQTGGTYVVHGTIQKTANDKLTIEIHLDQIV